jgi:hypothetical protein
VVAEAIAGAAAAVGAGVLFPFPFLLLGAVAVSAELSVVVADGALGAALVVAAVVVPA